MSRMKPLAIEECADPELRAALEHFVNTLGFVPNSLLTMQRVPAIAPAEELSAVLSSQVKSYDANRGWTTSMPKAQPWAASITACASTSRPSSGRAAR